MGYDASALMMVDICVSVGLVERYKNKKLSSSEFIQGYNEAMEERVLDKYWFSDDSEKLGNILYDKVNHEFKIKRDVHEIRKVIEDILKNQEWSEDEKNTKIEDCRINLIKFLKSIQEQNYGEMPFEELAELIERLEENVRG